MSRWADTDSDSDDEFQTHGDAGMVLQSINANLIGQVSSSFVRFCNVNQKMMDGVMADETVMELEL